MAEGNAWIKLGHEDGRDGGAHDAAHAEEDAAGDEGAVAGGGGADGGAADAEEGAGGDGDAAAEAIGDEGDEDDAEDVADPVGRAEGAEEALARVVKVCMSWVVDERPVEAVGDVAKEEEEEAEVERPETRVL
ncbi:hypothetical protein ColKHC_12355 [Colletotrichum higginsianum]|nr:hypothetical protein ColKHC_12355 [Colletotrichum higginsianum]